MRFTVDDKHLIKWMCEKYVEKTFALDVLTEDEVLIG